MGPLSHSILLADNSILALSNSYTRTGRSCGLERDIKFVHVNGSFLLQLARGSATTSCGGPTSTKVYKNNLETPTTVGVPLGCSGFVSTSSQASRFDYYQDVVRVLNSKGNDLEAGSGEKTGLFVMPTQTLNVRNKEYEEEKMTNETKTGEELEGEEWETARIVDWFVDNKIFSGMFVATAVVLAFLAVKMRRNRMRREEVERWRLRELRSFENARPRRYPTTTPPPTPPATARPRRRPMTTPPPTPPPTSCPSPLHPTPQRTTPEHTYRNIEIQHLNLRLEEITNALNSLRPLETLQRSSSTSTLQHDYLRRLAPPMLSSRLARTLPSIDILTQRRLGLGGWDSAPDSAPDSTMPMLDTLPLPLPLPLPRLNDSDLQQPTTNPPCLRDTTPPNEDAPDGSTKASSNNQDPSLSDSFTSGDYEDMSMTATNQYCY